MNADKEKKSRPVKKIDEEQLRYPRQSACIGG
jgi:hypothetical protein